MYINEKEIDAINAAMDFIEAQADGADDDKYPHDILDGLRSVFVKAKNSRSKIHFKYLVKKKVAELKKNKIAMA